MIEQALAGRSCRLHHTAKAVASHAWPILSLEAQAPCSDGSLHECRFPHVRLMDGVYYENTAIVAALVELQRRAGPDHGAELRLFASVANSCEPAKVAEGVAGCTTNNGYNQIEMLFANLPVAPTGERYPSEAGAAYRVGGLGGPLEGTLAYDARVFAERLPADWRAHGGSAFRTLTLNATTVDNPASGVRAGSRVTLLVLFGNVPPSCPVAQPPGVDDETVAACAALADGVCAFVRGMGAASSIGSYVEGATAR
jgi:adhesin HecA-like repeat protein